MSPVAADRLTCTTSVEVKIACDNASELWTAHRGSEDAPGEGGREKVLFCQLLRHTRDGPRRKNLGNVEQRWRRDGAQTLLGGGGTVRYQSRRKQHTLLAARRTSETAIETRTPEGP